MLFRSARGVAPSLVPLSVLGCMPKWLAGCDVMEEDVLGTALGCSAASRCAQQDDAQHCVLADVTHPYIYVLACMLSIATAIVNKALSSA